VETTDPPPLLEDVQTGTVACPASYSMGKWTSTSEVKRPGHKACQSHSSFAKVKNAWISTFTPPYYFIESTRKSLPCRAVTCGASIFCTFSFCGIICFNVCTLASSSLILVVQFHSMSSKDGVQQYGTEGVYCKKVTNKVKQHKL
jgi:hypothetical protein